MKHKGFTLVELIVVLAIMGIMSMGVQMAMGSRTSADLNAWAQQIKNDIRYSQRMAMAENCKYILTFDRANSKYTIQAVYKMDDKEVFIKKQVKEVILDKDVMIYVMKTKDTDEEEGKEGNEIYFKSTGTISSGFSLQLKKNRTYITLKGMVGTGRINIVN